MKTQLILRMLNIMAMVVMVPFNIYAQEKKTFTVNGVSFNMIKYQCGSFMMGASVNDSEAYSWEKPAHRVVIPGDTRYIGETEVTQELWEAVMGNNPSYFKGKKRPVECVSWNDCQLFLQKLYVLTGQNFRLPIEEEWEFVARGGVKSRGYKYSGSNNINDVGWYDGNSSKQTHDVATKAPNELGVYDMTGNVWEWCQNHAYIYNGNNDEQLRSDFKRDNVGSARVARGGSWGNEAGCCRVSFRLGNTPDYGHGYLGLRLAL